MFIRKYFLGAVAAAGLVLCGWAGSASAAAFTTIDGVILMTDDGTNNLISAWGVDVGGEILDVTFVDGNCASVFNGCDQDSDFFSGGTRKEQGRPPRRSSTRYFWMFLLGISTHALSLPLVVRKEE